MPQSVPRYPFPLLLASVLALASACSGVERMSDAQLPIVRQRPERVLLAPVSDRVRPGPLRDEAGTPGQEMPVDPVRAETRFEEVLQRVWPKLRTSFRNDLRDRLSAVIRDARLKRYDGVLHLTIERQQVRYVGLNGWWVPNLLVYIALWVPSLFIADENYVAEYAFRADYYDAYTGRLEWSERIVGRAEAALDDLDRGWILLGIIRIPLFDDVGDTNWASVWRTLGAMARHDAESRLLLRIAEMDQTAGR